MNIEEKIINSISIENNITKKQIKNTLNLLEKGNTVPFIARYRKEMTENLDEDQINVIEKEYTYYLKLEKRKQSILDILNEKGLLTNEIKKVIFEVSTMQELEDFYSPYKENKKTKASIAEKNGLKPLANILLECEVDPKEEYLKFLNENILTISDAINGAMDIVAQTISMDISIKKMIREEFLNNSKVIGRVKAKGKELDENLKYEMYYEFEQNFLQIPSYRILALSRAEKEKIISYNIKSDEDKIADDIFKMFTENKKNKKFFKNNINFFKESIGVSLKRLILPSLNREFKSLLMEKATRSAINIFSKNLENLLLQKPLKYKTILGIDPAFRTGCKLSVINSESELLIVDIIYPNKPQNDIINSSKKINDLVKKYSVEQIVIGNGTASRETKKFIKELNLDIPVNLISEAGASVYSASKIAQEEFPNLTLEYRSAISIARRIQDPMAELVKIPPKSIGVGQYQHDINQKVLEENLDFVMIKNINKVGVDLNTASVSLLKYVSGMNKSVSQEIVKYREENGQYKNRDQLKNVKKLGAKTFNQAAGFLKIYDGDNYLDSTFIHPEDYEVANEIMNFKNNNIDVYDQVKLNKIMEKYTVTKTKIYELIDYIEKPNLDIRQEINSADFLPDIETIEDLKIGQLVQGEVRNIVQFGAFIDIGLKNDVLIHVSEISKTFVKNVENFLQIGDIKEFKVKDIDLKKKKIQLTLKK